MPSLVVILVGKIVIQYCHGICLIIIIINILMNTHLYSISIEIMASKVSDVVQEWYDIPPEIVNELLFNDFDRSKDTISVPNSLKKVLN